MSMIRLTNLKIEGAAELGDEIPLLFEGPPGVDSVDVKIHSYRIKGEDVIFDLTLDPYQFLRQSIQLDQGHLETLQLLKEAGLPAEQLLEIMDRAQHDDDLNVAILSQGGVDHWPTFIEI